MKNLFLSLSLISLFMAKEAFAAKGLSIVLDVDDATQTHINKNIRQPAGLKPVTTLHHITIAYIDLNLPNDKMEALAKKP